jgi:hypothetical protein
MLDHVTDHYPARRPSARSTPRRARRGRVRRSEFRPAQRLWHQQRPVRHHHHHPPHHQHCRLPRGRRAPPTLGQRQGQRQAAGRPANSRLVQSCVGEQALARGFVVGGTAMGWLVRVSPPRRATFATTDTRNRPRLTWDNWFLSSAIMGNPFDRLAQLARVSRLRFSSSPASLLT